MTVPDLLERFRDDQRAVSAVIGFILVFGILMLMLTVYQAQIVPEQNAQTEFEHFEDSQNELIELRNAISTTGQADVSQFPSITLGTNYQTRLLTINPPSPTGTLQTSDEYNITIANETHQANITTRFLEYQPGYNELRMGSTQYEHSVLYFDDREHGNGVNIIEDQNIVKDGTVRITALQNQFQQTGTGRVTLELYPQMELDTSDFPDPDGENFTVTVPTRLDENEYWNGALGDASGIYQGVDDDEHGEGIHALNLSVDESELEVNTIGIREEPDENPAKNIQAGGGDGDTDGGGGVTDDESLSFDGLPTATASSSGSDVDEVEFNFEVSNPNNINYKIKLGVINPSGNSSNREVSVNPSGTLVIDETHGTALEYKMTGNSDTYLDVEITLTKQDGSVIDSRAGRIEKENKEIVLGN